MPTTKKRVNITVPEQVYDRLALYKQKNGITSDATACLQLIVRQLDALDNSEKMLEMMQRFTMDELQTISNEGFALIKQVTEQQKTDK